jgi:hypothetical protein
MSGSFAAVAVIWAGLLGWAFILGLRTKPSVLLVRVEREMAALRAEVDGYRTAQEHLAVSLERRLDDLELATAKAANEVRMVSNEVMARLPTEPAVTQGEAS